MSIGKCPTTPSGLKCLSTGECNVCKLINGNYEGCDVTSSTPVCDADASTSAIDDSAVNTLSVCVGCKKDGTQ